MIRVICAWLLYGAGHVISRPMVRFDRMAWIYPGYNRLMVASAAIQGDDPRGPWRAAE
jgi:hypothetical protein